MQYLFIYLLTINIIGAMTAALDKRRARKSLWRIPEKTFFLLCALGACPGVYFSMRHTHHKTRHKRFMWGIPTIFVLQVAATVVLYYLKNQ